MLAVPEETKGSKTNQYQQHQKQPPKDFPTDNTRHGEKLNMPYKSSEDDGKPVNKTRSYYREFPPVVCPGMNP